MYIKLHFKTLTIVLLNFYFHIFGAYMQKIDIIMCFWFWVHYLFSSLD